MTSGRCVVPRGSSLIGCCSTNYLITPRNPRETRKRIKSYFTWEWMRLRICAVARWLRPFAWEWREMNCDPVHRSLTELCERNASEKGRRDNPVIELCRVWNCTLGCISPKHGSLPPPAGSGFLMGSWLWPRGVGAMMRGPVCPSTPTRPLLPQSFRHTAGLAFLSDTGEPTAGDPVTVSTCSSPTAGRRKNCLAEEVWLKRSFRCATCEDAPWLSWNQNIVQTTHGEQNELWNHVTFS